MYVLTDIKKNLRDISQDSDSAGNWEKRRNLRIHVILNQKTLLNLAWYLAWCLQSDNFQVRSLLLWVNKCLAQYCTDIDSGERGIRYQSSVPLIWGRKLLQMLARGLITRITYMWATPFYLGDISLNVINSLRWHKEIENWPRPQHLFPRFI